MDVRKLQSAFCRGLVPLACAALMAACGGRAPTLVQPESAGFAMKPAKVTSTVDESYSAATASDTRIVEETTTQFVPLSGNVLSVKFPKYAETDDVVLQKATFWVPADAMTDGQGHEITMTAQSGTTLDDIQVLFGPSGLTFEPNATLWLTLLGPVTEEDVQQVAHIAGDGYVESIDVLSSKKGNAKLLVTIRIPGFSRYSLGDGSWAPEVLNY